MSTSRASSSSWWRSKCAGDHNTAMAADTSNTVRVKIEFKDQIRIAMVNKNATLQFLKASITKTFEELKNVSLPSITVRYKDDDDDMITVTTDEALEDLLKSDSCKISVTASNLPPPSTASSANVSSTLCRFHARGYCRYGDKCKFLHSNENGERTSPTMRTTSEPFLITSWLQTQLEKSAADNIEELSSPPGMEMIHRIVRNHNISQRDTSILVRLLAKDEIRTSMMRHETNKIYGSITGSLFLMKMQVQLRSLPHPSAQDLEPYLLLIEELQTRTSSGWKEVPLDTMKALIEELPESRLKDELVQKVSRLVQHRHKLQLIRAIEEPDDTSLQVSDFRAIPIIPSMEELLLADGLPLPINKVGFRYASVAKYLETHFRLLREDFIQPLREGIKDYKNGVRNSELRVYTDVRVVGMRVTGIGIESRVSFAVVNSSKKEVDWKASKRLMFGSLLCLSHDNFQSFAWATVIRHDPKVLEAGAVDVELVGDGKELETSQSYVMVESSAAYFEAYSHVLQSLQVMEDIPFEEHLISLVPTVKEPAYMMRRGQKDLYNLSCVFPESKRELGKDSLHVLEEWPEWRCSLDDSQKRALKHALTKRLALIQGPPGTGKTFIGLMLVKILLRNLVQDSMSLRYFVGQGGTRPLLNETARSYFVQPESEGPMRNLQLNPNLLRFAEEEDKGYILEGPILVVCYTNHALDQFLEGIYRTEKRLIRIGGRCKSTELQNRNLQRLLQEERAARNVPGPYVRAAARARDVRSDLEDKIRETVDLLNTTYATEGMLHGVAAEEQISTLFHGCYKRKQEEEVVVRLWLNASNSNDQARGYHAAAVDDDNWIKVKSKRQMRVRNEAVQEENEQEPEDTEDQIPLQLLVNDPFVWNLSRAARRKLHQYWLDEIHSHAQRRFAQLSKEYQVACKQYKEADSELQLTLLRRAKVVGMTTTGAAKHHDILMSLKPEIVIVEEAAEVLESHILACLSPHTKHLILIGDHLQLRPSVATHKLATKHRLDVSLFERLVQSGVGYASLDVQRRMKPSISKLISSIYPKLSDHPSVMEYKDMKGFKSSVFFMDHKAAEEQNEDAGSKVNVTEANLIVEVCNYLLNQDCYSPKDITILAMYNGQVREIISRLTERLRYHESQVRPISSTEDEEDENSTRSSWMPRVSSVDDFQGEECNIILLSLVRSNLIPDKEGAGKIGFLNISNRVCVALSRARMGLYIFGNAELLADKSPLWRSIIKSMKEDGILGPELILRCENHPCAETVIHEVHQFKQVEDGGCSRPCEYQLNCGHACPRRCHPVSHDKIVCPKMCHKPYDGCEHRCQRTCHGSQETECPPCQARVLKQIPKCGHMETMGCSASPESASCFHACPKTLSCGHKCRKFCSRNCTTDCDEEVLRELLCGHKAKLLCHKDPQTVTCNEPCEGMNPKCHHKCRGTCGTCKQGTEHIDCEQECGRDLPCGHQCGAKCSIPCPPCTGRCQKRCLHSRCDLECGLPCRPCIEACAWSCQHFNCELLCYEACTRPRCNEPCSKLLKCGHPCIGLCGEICPRKCRKCHPKTMDVITQMTLEESEETDLFIELIDCGHVFEVSGMDQWMDMDDTSAGSSEAILLKPCPACKVPIRRTYRYGNVVKKKILQIEEVKKRVYGYEKVQAGSNMLKDGLLSEAREYFGDAIKIYPGLLEAHLGMGATLCSMRDFRFSIAHLRLIVLRSCFAEKVGNLAERYNPLPEQVSFQSLTATADEALAVKALLQWASAMTSLKSFTEAIQLCDIVLQHDSSHETAFKFKQQAENSVVTQQVIQVVSAEFARTGHWYQCPNGHVYAVGECGGPMETSVCPDCKAEIGGRNHAPAAGNVHSNVDGSAGPLYSDQTGLGNFLDE